MRVALLGASHWNAGFHAEAVRAAGAELAGVWDSDPAVAVAFAAKHGGHATASVAASLAERPGLVVGLGRGPQAAALLAAFAVPLGLLAAILALALPAVMLILAAAVALTGLLLERWLFFAQATHTAVLFYGRPV